MRVDVFHYVLAYLCSNLHLSQHPPKLHLLHLNHKPFVREIIQIFFDLSLVLLRLNNIFIVIVVER